MAGTDGGLVYGTAQARWVLFATVLGSALAFIDGTVVTIALPLIGREMHAGTAALQWTVNGYGLTLAAFLLLGGSLGDRLGRRRVFRVGVVWFALASLLCGLAPDVRALIAARAMLICAGLMAAGGLLALVTVPTSMAGVRPRRDRGALIRRAPPRPGETGATARPSPPHRPHRSSWSMLGPGHTRGDRSRTMGQRVVVVGAGYGGTLVAKTLDDVLEVMLIEPKDAFVHAAAALRAVVDPTWLDRVFFPYDQLLRHGRIIRDRVRLASAARVHLSATESIDTDFLVLATGTSYPFPAKYLEDQVTVAAARLVRTRAALAAARRVLLVGAGPVGLELAGELTSAFPHLAVTVVEQGPDILPTGDYLPELRETVRSQLDDRGVRLVLDSRLGYLPPVDVGTFSPFTVQTTTGIDIDADIWFRCYGSHPMTDYLDADLARARHEDGTLSVTSTMSVVGHERVFAIGDITDVRETKRASAARAHADVVATNIRDLIEGRAPSATYSPAPERIVLPLGPDGGASQLSDASGLRTVRGSAETSALKGVDLMSDSISAVLGRRRARHA